MFLEKYTYKSYPTQDEKLEILFPKPSPYYFSPPKNQEAREANFAKYFPPSQIFFCWKILRPRLGSSASVLANVPRTFSPPAFRKISLAFRISALRLLCPKTLWRSAERFPALLLQQKLCAKHRAFQNGKCRETLLIYF